ncbi:hypothetical protein ACEPAH_5519 [Sanghuangporus vaninii]
MLRHPWRTLAGSAVLVGSSAYIYRRVTRPKTAHETFDIRAPTVGPDGKRTYTTQTIRIQSMPEIETRLKENAVLRASSRPGHIIWKHATAHLASNDPIEDAHAEAIVQRDQQDGDYLFFTVMDGHSGTHTSRLLSKTLIPAIALQLRELTTSPGSFDSKAGRASFLDSIRSLFSSAPKSPGASTTPYDADPKFVSLAIQTAFAMIDSEIVNAPLRLLHDHLKEIGAKGNESLPDLSKHPMALPSMAPALSGSCALLALLDTAHRDLYVACTGDCRAVAGVWEEAPDGCGNGTWRVDVLSDDQTGRNASELKRLQSEHPKGEASTVVQRGRILGGLEPSRAFGDARYKWPLHIQQLLARVFMDGNGQTIRRPPPDFKTPPYVTAQPVITYRKLDFLPLSEYLPLQFPPLNSADSIIPPSSAQPPMFSWLREYAPFTKGSEQRVGNATLPPSSESSSPVPTPRRPPSSSLRFIILATDGLWDQISSQDAVALVGAHLSGLRSPSVPRSVLNTYAPTRKGDSPGVEGKANPPTSSKDQTQKQNEGPGWAFVDHHPGVHLLRNAFGGADTDRLRRLLSIPAPLSRRFRDDVTVTVVWWEDGRVNEAKTENVNLKAKL